MGNHVGTVSETPFAPVTDTVIQSWADLGANVQSGHWWRENPYLNTANKDLMGNIQLLTEDGDVRKFQAVVDTSSGQLYKPVIARLYFSYTDVNNYRYAGIRTQVVAVNSNGEDIPRQLLMVEIGQVSGGTETVLASHETVLDSPVQTVSLDLSISKINGEFPAALDWTAGAQFGTVNYTFASTTEAKAGLMVSKAQGGYSAKFTGINIEGVNVTHSNTLTSPVYQYALYNNKTCTWDFNGNLTGFGNDYFVYDAFNRMIEANGVKYKYDPQNRRIAKIMPNGDIYEYVYNGWSVIAEFKNDVLQRQFIEGISTDEHLCMINYTQDPAGEKYYYILNTRNGVEKVVDSAGDLVEYYEYTAYGEATLFDNYGQSISVSGIGNPYSFQGRRMDPESNLMYFRNRQYSPEMKRFISMDPLGYVDSMNLYETFGCDPVNFTDRLGLHAANDYAEQLDLPEGLVFSREHFTRWYGGRIFSHLKHGGCEWAPDLYTMPLEEFKKRFTKELADEYDIPYYPEDPHYVIGLAKKAWDVSKKKEQEASRKKKLDDKLAEDKIREAMSKSLSYFCDFSIGGVWASHRIGIHRPTLKTSSVSWQEPIKWEKTYKFPLRVSGPFKGALLAGDRLKQVFGGIKKKNNQGKRFQDLLLLRFPEDYTYESLGSVERPKVSISFNGKTQTSGELWYWHFFRSFTEEIVGWKTVQKWWIPKHLYGTGKGTITIKFKDFKETVKFKIIDEGKPGF